MANEPKRTRFTRDFREMKSACWQSRWRGIGETPSGHPSHYVPLTGEEMLHAAATGMVRIPDHVIPEPVLRQRNRRRTLDGFDIDGGLLDRVVMS